MGDTSLEGRGTLGDGGKGAEEPLEKGLVVKRRDGPGDSDMNPRKRIPWMEGATGFNGCKDVKIGTYRS